MRRFNNQIVGLLTESGIDIEIFANDELLSTQGRMVAYLINAGVISYDQYIEMYEGFRSRNPYIETFEMAPRSFGETWLENRILGQFPSYNPPQVTRGFLKAKKRIVNQYLPDYRDPLNKVFGSQFDFLCFDGDEKYKVEVKACRANSEEPLDRFGTSSLTSRAYSYEEARNAGFKFHFQQIKPGFCDVFILVGVCTDAILYWILTSEELRNEGGLSPQHPTSGITDINDERYEGQVYKRVEDYENYLVSESDILNVILKKFKGEE